MQTSMYICIQCIQIFEYFCLNISEHWSLKIGGNTGIKGVLFSFFNLNIYFDNIINKGSRPKNRIFHDIVQNSFDYPPYLIMT